MYPDAEPELIRPRKPSRKGCDWFGRQELPRLILAGLRAAGQPLSAAELALIVMERKGLPVDAMTNTRIMPPTLAARSDPSTFKLTFAPERTLCGQ